ncbi:YhdP family protein [Shewanella sp. KJ2020]|uniref:YhdP family protein n=1 Tax=Shewanella sp. KJ2020 TaxID=2919172 RepID=UPI0020A77E0B|nr:TIGR02099 family protein [Shewanella sp. KJ2020]
MATLFTAKKLSRFCWQLLAIFLVLCALAVSLIRGLLPQVDEVRQRLVDYVKSEYQIEVRVEELSAQWQAFGPAVNIDHLIIPPQDKLPVTVIVKNVQIKLDFWQSVLARSPRIEDVNFDGVSVALDMDKLTDTTPNSVPSEAAQIDWLYKLLLKQLDRFSLSNATVQLLSQQHEYRPIHIRRLNWHNSGERHRGAGEIYLDNNASDNESLGLQLDIKGDGAAPDTLSGQIYLVAQSLDLGEWASRQQNPYNPKQKLPLEGVVNLKAWFDFAHRSLSSGVVQFEPSWLQWSMEDKPQKFEIQSGSIAWVPEPKGWKLISSDLDFITNGEHWPALKLGLKQQDKALFGYINRLDVQTFLPLLPLVPGVDLATLKQWSHLSPEGSIGPIRLYQDEQQPLLASADIQQLHWQKRDGIPNTSPLDIHLAWQDNTLIFSLPKQAYTVDFGDEFNAPLSFNSGQLIGLFDTEQSSLSLPKVQFDNPDIGIDAALKLDFSATMSMSLAANVAVKNAANADRYFPVKAMGSALAEYLDGAIKAGQSQNAQVLWQGPLANFPFDDNTGVFQAAFTLTDAEYLFQPDWPAVTDLSLDALFENARMDIWVNQGKLMDVVADGAHVFIPELGEHSLLKIQAELATQGPAATQVLQASPLADSIGNTLKLVQVKGAVSGNLDISIPLYEGEEEDIRGQIGFENTPVYIAEPGIALAGVTGTVQFANDKLEGKGIKAKLFEQPLELSFNTQPVGKDYGLNVKLKSRWDLNRLPAALHNPLSGFYQGKFAWNGTLNMLFNDQGYQIEAKVASDLVGTSLTLPGAFAKPIDEPRPLLAEFIGDQQSTTLTVRLDKQAEFVGGFEANTGARFSYFDLLLGRLFAEDEARIAELGHIQIDVTSGKLANWLPVINAFVAEDTQPKSLGILTDNAPSQNLFPPVVGIDANIGKFDLLGQGLTGLVLRAKPNDTGWRFNASASEFEGWVDFYPNWKTQGLKVVASKFYFAPEVKKEGEADFGADQVLTNLPPVAVNVEDFRFFDKPFGQLVLQAGPQASGYRIQTLSLSTKDVNLQGAGIWRQQDGHNNTDLSLTLNATQFNHLTHQLGIDPGVNEAPLEVKADLSWQGAPYAFSLETLNGKVQFALGKGHLSQVSDKGARIFSLFSLDSLVRKLSLDFSDVFGQGMYFNSFGGNLQIDNGVVKTTDTEMDAIAGNMKVRGYTDLTTESLNYDIRFVPQLASSVPTVVLLSTSAWTLGLGAFALTKVLEPVIEVISEIRFRVTGTMADPVVEELERKSKEIEIPESILPMLEPPKVEPAVTEPAVEPIKQLQGDNHAHQPVAMSEQSRRQRQSAVYRIAA